MCMSHIGFFYNNIHYDTHVGVFLFKHNCWWWITHSVVKEPCGKCVVIKIKTLLLKMDVDGEEHGVKEMGFEKNVEQQ